MKHIDLTGQRYGKLVVLSQFPKEGRYYRYLCECDCGNTVDVRAENLRSGKVKYDVYAGFTGIPTTFPFCTKWKIDKAGLTKEEVLKWLEKTALGYQEVIIKL